MNNKANNSRKAIFYPGPMHLFWTTGIYFLNELSKQFKTTAIFENATIHEVETIRDILEGQLDNVLVLNTKYRIARHKYYKEIAKKVINKYQPWIVLVPSDKLPFTCYLLRFSKRILSINLCYQTGFMMAPMEKERILLYSFQAARYKQKFGINFKSAFLLALVMSYLKHFWHYFAAPIIVGERPFIGRSSTYLRTGRAAMRDGDYFIINSDREKKFCVIDDLAEEKIHIIPNPITWNSTQKLLKRLIQKKMDQANFNNDGKGYVTLFLDDYTQVVDRNLKPISSNRYNNNMKHLIDIMSKKLKDAYIIIKPHPNTVDNDKQLKFVSDSIRDKENVEIINKNIDALALIAKSDIIVAEVSTVLYTASIIGHKKVISLDFNKRFLGNVYENFPNIEYYNDFGKFSIAISKDHNRSNLERLITNGDVKFNLLLNSLLKLAPTRIVGSISKPANEG